jgi:hypothetical protein
LVATLVSLLVVQYTRRSDFRKATQWHRVHGDLILVDGHKLSLPQDWWEEDSPEAGRHVIVKASRSLTKTWQTGISFVRKGPSEAEADEDRIRKNLERFIEVENKGNPRHTSSLVVLNGVSTRIYCKKTIVVEPLFELRCDVVGAPTLIRSVGLPNTLKDVEGIISTFD